MEEKGKIRDFYAILPHVALSLALLALLLYFAGAEKAIAAITSCKIEFFLAAFVAYFCINLLMAFRLHTLLKAMKSAPSFTRTLSCHYLGMLASDFTPARSGYFAAAFSLNSHGVPLSKSLAAMLGPQLFDFLLKAGASAVAVALFVSYFGLPGSAAIAAAVAILAMLCFVAIIVGLLFLPSLSAPFLPLLKKLPFGSKLHFMAEKMQINAPLMRAKLPLILSILAMTWVLKGFEWWMLSEAVGLHANLPVHPLVFFMLLQPLATILQFIPTPTPAGAGLSEAGIVGVMLLFGSDAAIATAFGLLTRGVMLSQDWLGVFEWKSLRLDFVDEENW